MAECSEHFLNGLATIAAVNTQLLQPNLVIMRSETLRAISFTLYPEQYKYNIRVRDKHVNVGTIIISPTSDADDGHQVHGCRQGLMSKKLSRRVAV